MKVIYSKSPDFVRRDEKIKNLSCGLQCNWYFEDEIVMGGSCTVIKGYYFSLCFQIDSQFTDS